MRLFLMFGVILAPIFSWATLDGSSLVFDANSNSTSTFVQLLVTDPAGRQTGWQGPGGPQIDNIPNSNCIVESSDDEETPISGTESAVVSIGQVAGGQYTMTLFALTATPYEVWVRAAHTDGSSSTTTFHGFIAQNATRQYVANFDPIPGASLGIIKMVTFDTLRQDLQTTFQLDEIGNVKSVQHLDGILADGEKALAKKEDSGKGKGEQGNDRKKEAIEKLREFIGQLEEAARVGSKESNRQGKATEHGQEDGGKRFVSPPALNALSSDAKTLIVQLGGSLQDH